MISVKNLVKKFDSTFAVNIESLNITKGEVFGLVGNNGAGKTTLLRLILDLLKPDEGSVFSAGIPVFQSEHWKKYTGSFLDNNFLIEFLKPHEYLDFIGYINGIDTSVLKSRLEVFKNFMNGESLENKKYVRNLSAGNKQKIGVLSAMILYPDVLILDEPFNFLDPSSQIILKQILKNLNSNYGTTIIISSHNLTHISDICTRIGLMEKGMIIKDVYNSATEINEINKYFQNQIS